LADRIVRLSPDPLIWFVGQFASYILKPLPAFSQHLEQQLVHHPGAAIHVRRTDKSLENSPVPLDSYVEAIEEQLDIKGIEKKSIYVATEDPKVLQDLIKTYPSIDFVSHIKNAVASKNHSDR
jgi:hypothetical protein